MPGPKLRRAKARLVQADDGSGRIQVLTEQRLESFAFAIPRREGLSWSDEWITGVRTPEEILGGAEWGLRVSKPQDAPRWRHLQLWVSVQIGEVWESLYEPPEAHFLHLERYLELWSGSAERRVLELIIEQPSLSLEWVNEDIVVMHEISDDARRLWKEALLDTEAVAEAEWREEIAQLEWELSPAFRPGRSRPKKRRRGEATPPPGVTLPFFAARSGAVPKAKNGDIDGVPLPPGRRLPARVAAFWVSKEPVPNLELLAPWLASQFSQTGLWPLLWRIDGPEHHTYADHDVEAIDHVDLNTVLRERWTQEPLFDPDEHHAFPEFPGMASGTTGPNAENPFPDWALVQPTRLLLVPCNRPADAITVIGGVDGENDHHFISAMLRSFEERFGAVVFEASAGGTRVSVARPPDDAEQARLLASEIWACHIDKVGLKTRPLRDIANAIQHGETDFAHPQRLDHLSATVWDIAW